MPDEVEHFAQIRVAQYWPQIEAGATDPGRVAGELADSFIQAASHFPQPVRPYGVLSGVPPEPRRELYYHLLGGLCRILGLGDWLRAWYFCRALSILMGLASLALTWWTAREIFPDEPVVGILAAGVVALTPQIAAVAATVNPDVLAALAGALFFALGASLWRRGLRWPAAVGLAAVLIGLPWLKKTTYFFGPLVVLVGLWRIKIFLARRPWAWAWWAVLISFAAALAATALFYPPAANRLAAWIGVPLFRSYDPAFDPKYFHQPGLVERISGGLKLTEPGFWLHLKMLTVNCFKSFWAYFGYFDVPLSWWWYWGAAAMVLAGASGWLRVRRRGLEPVQRRCLALFSLGVFLSFGFVLFRDVVLAPGSLTQGRHLFPILTPLAVMWAWGFKSLWPPKALSWAAGACLAYVWVMDFNALWGVVVPWFYRLHP